MSAENSLVPFQHHIPTEEDLGIGLGSSSLDFRLPRAWMQPGMMIFIWLLTAGLMSITAMYHVVLNGPGASRLAWSSSAGAVLLLLGALGIKQIIWKRLSASTLNRSMSALLLTAFVIPTAQLLLTLVITQDLSYTTYILLIVIGYALVAATSESLLLLFTLTLAAWSACALRSPAGAWVAYILPWMGTIALSLLIHHRFNSTKSAGSLPQKLPESSVLDVDLEGPLRSALADRDHAQSLHHAQLQLLQDLCQRLTSDRSLDEVGTDWLQQLITRLPAQRASIWIKENEKPVQPAAAVGSALSANDPLLNLALKSSNIVHENDHWACPLDLGMNAKGVLIVQVVHMDNPQMLLPLLSTLTSQLSAFIRWQITDSDNEQLHQDLLQFQTRSQQLQAELEAEQETHRQVNEHLQNQWAATQVQLDLAQHHTAEETGELAHWKTEAKRWQELVETAQTEHDTLTQLLEETEAELNQLKAASSQNNRTRELEAKLIDAEKLISQVTRLEQELKSSESERLAIEKHWDAAEKQLQEVQARLQKAQTETEEAHTEWERETQTVSLLTSALRTLPDAVLVFDLDGKLLYENETARILKGNSRNQPGEHPVWKAAISRESMNRKQAWTIEFETGDKPDSLYQLHIAPLSIEKEYRGFVILARQKFSSGNDERDAGPRFFGALAKTLEPQLTQLISHSQLLLEVNTDHDARRKAIVGLLQHGHYLRRLLTQAIDYSTLQNGSTPLIAAPVSPWTLIQQVVTQLQAMSEEKGITLSLEPVSSLPTTLTVAADRLMLVLQQLIGQEVRQAVSGIITVRIGMTQTSPMQQAGGILKFDIDGSQALYGQENPLDLETTILSKQVQAIHAEWKRPSNHHHSLLLKVSSTEMLNMIPLDRLPIDSLVLRDCSRNTLTIGKVLVVADGLESQRVTAFQLERLGMRSEILASGERALERVKEDHFDAVLWDADKQDKSPGQAAQELRLHHFQGGILAIQQLGQTWNREEFLLSGGDGIISRPIVPAVWRHALESYMSKTPLPTEDVIESMPSLYEADREFAPLIRSYAGRLPCHLADMRAALQVADMARLARLAHALVDGGQLYGYPALTDIAQQLEKTILLGRDNLTQSQLLDHLSQVVHQIERFFSSHRVSSTLSLPSALTKAA